MGLYSSLRAKVKAAYLDRFDGWGPEESLRYLPIRDALRARGLDQGSILEVGSGGKGISPYVRHAIVGCDLAFPEPGPFTVHRVKATAEALPVRSRAFDAVVSVDALEHIPSKDRPPAIAEMVRAAKRTVVLMVPSGAPALAHDKSIADHARMATGKVHHFLEEHIEHGLPEQRDLEAALVQACQAEGRPVKLHSEMRDNLALRAVLLKAWHSGSPWKMHLVKRSTVLMPLLYRVCSFGTCYRAMVVADIG